MTFLDSIRTPREIGGLVDSKIRSIALKDDINTVLLVGSPNKNGTAKSLVSIVSERYQAPFAVQPLRLFVNEHSTEFYENLISELGTNRMVQSFNYMPSKELLSSETVRQFYASNQECTKLLVSTNDALRGLDEETKQFNTLTNDGITKIRQDNEIGDSFDFVIVDGAFFSSMTYNNTLGSKYILLYDINSIKNKSAFDSYAGNSEYERVSIGKSVQFDDEMFNGNGVSLFKLK